MNEAEIPMEGLESGSEALQAAASDGAEHPIEAPEAASIEADGVPEESKVSEEGTDPEEGTDDSKPVEPEVEIVSLEAEMPESAVEVAPAEPIEILITAEEIEPPSLELEADDMSHATRSELLAQNTELLGWIHELERSLAECQVDFKSHLRQFEQQERLLESRTRELISSQEQVVALTRDLEMLKKESQRKKILSETLTAQLEAGQERIAQMERECTLSQRRCAEQAQQLLQAEGLCRDLKSRLNRQQRNTLQFKAALEKSLEMSVTPANFELPDLEVEPIDVSTDFFPRSKPVKPWSQQLDDDAVTDGDSEGAADGEYLADVGQVLETSDPAQDQKEAEVETVFDPVAAASLTEALKSEMESLVSGRDLERDLEDVVSEEQQPPSTDTTEEAIAKPEPASRISFVPPIVPKASIPNPAGFVAACLGALEDSESSKEAETDSEPHAAKDASTEGTKAGELLDQDKTPYEGEFDLNQQANWPAPLVNPVRPAKKKIDSLAAIDLPNFPKAPISNPPAPKAPATQASV